MSSNRFLGRAVRIGGIDRDAPKACALLARRRGNIALFAAAAAGLAGVHGIAFGQQAAPAAQPTAVLEEVVVTGSSIAQRAEASALPVTILTDKDIAKTGFTTATDLLQNLPAMQGFVPASSSVNGGGAGVTTAALHSLQSKYTLVLVDGQRVAPAALGSVQGGGFGVNIESIPLDAVERVEVLTDGASALYGADAIAGVVNFILKKDRTDGNAFYDATVPGQPGGGAWSAGLSKGFGDLKSDGYNLFFSYSHDIQNKLQASDRAVSRRGAFFPFSYNGTNYIYNNRTSNTEPANIIVSQVGVSYNPFYIANGNCGNGPLAAPLTVAGNTTCRFNYSATVEDIPSSTRDSGLLRGTFRVGDSTTIWAEALVSQFDLVSQYAPPAQPLGISPTQLPLLWNTYVVGNPLLAGHTICGAPGSPPPCKNPDGSNRYDITSATLGYRAVTAGGRTDDWGTLARHMALGVDSSVGDWDLKGRIVQSHSKATDTGAGGYLDFSQFQSAIAAGAYDPVLATGASSIQTAILHSQFSATYSDVTSFEVNAQHKLFDMGGGASVLSLGAEYALTKFKVDYSNLALSQSGFSTQPNATDYPVGGGFGLVPFEADRTNYGLFAEFLMPIMKELNVTASARYDSYARVHSTTVFSATPDPVTGLQNQLAPADLGNTFSDTTYKLAFHYQPIDMVALRGSYGTGFRAPALSDIAGALSFFGSTSGSYACPFPGSPGCLPGSSQYDLLSGPNGLSGGAGLKPEKSTQYSFGVRVDPVQSVSLGLDYWHVKLTNQIESFGIAEQVAFNNPQQYASLFVNPYQDPAGFQTIALQEVPFNGGEASYSGLDWNFNFRTDVGIGMFRADWTGTYMLKQEYTNGPGMPTLTDLGVNGPDQQVVFRTISNLALSLQTGGWTNTVQAHYKSGYRDIAYTAGNNIVFLQAAGGGLGAASAFPGLQVPSFITVDWQTVLEVRDNLQLTFGIKNLTDKPPPLSLQDGGGGNQAGYDGRYYDPIGRAYYFKVSFKF
jgi:iron complex outermembrane receptor protein